ncbi:hypothetical protein BaRGS_00038111 [Batillaria attramentaria]|uniref:Uncharacterized protein n=1 Tax=Batillaria attramentaria TaxID=370345 RepID=A0ABD0J6Z2_9CAEN
MLATLKAGEETRRLIRETTRSCSRNCNKPNILTLMERTYVNLPDLLPEKARQRMAEQEAAERDQPPLDLNRSSSGKLRRTNGRFDIDEEEAELRGNLPIYHIQYTALRDMGGTRRNSVFS